MPRTHLTTSVICLLGVCTSALAGQGDDALRERLFNEFCAGRSAAQSEAALRASGQFETPVVYEAAGARYVTFPLRGGTRAGVTVVTGDGAGLQCSAGVNNVGINLFETGRITKG